MNEKELLSLAYAHQNKERHTGSGLRTLQSKIQLSGNRVLHIKRRSHDRKIITLRLYVSGVRVAYADY